MDYPPNCLRGVARRDWITDSGGVHVDVFPFSSKNKRDDGWIEESINWEDGSHVLPSMLKELDEESALRYPGGVVVIGREDVDRLNRRPVARDRLSYERTDEPDNPHHGNLLLLADTKPKEKKLIRANICGCVTRVVGGT
jgi:hypothetical protein